MDDTTPQLSPDEYGKASAKSEVTVTPDFEPSIDVSKDTEELDIVVPDILPPETVGEELLLGDQGVTVELVAPELLPSAAEVSELAEEQLVAPEELPSQE